ncbi:hypothetical protein [Bradyrhizobium sp. AS23.2]|uniref:hypothetical protein n=1 Tax=Bradyrhizobium sp. AS23.2 TaxID=1680155 RepID=UPI00142FF2F1|nr:hypothetical protein [Bradyrhizobium sp. AS23.2]
MAQGRAVVTTISHGETGSQWPQQLTGGVDRIVLRALLDEELPGDEQCSGENEREHRGRELTGIIHRADFSVIGLHGERRPTAGSSYMC